MPRCLRLTRPAALFTSLATVAALTVPMGVSVADTGYVGDPASLVDPLIGTSGFVNDFPGADVPFGMVQWSPDTPSRPQGGGYEYEDDEITGFSLTHISGPGCSAFGDVPILPTTGAVGTDPGQAKVPFSHDDEDAEPGYYRVRAGDVDTALTATKRSGMAEFAFPSGEDGNLLFKLSDSAAGTDATRVRIAGDRRVTGSVTSGHFCGADNSYTMHFDIVFDQPFAAFGTWKDSQVTKSSTSMKRTGDEPTAKRATPTPSPSGQPRYHGKAADGDDPDRAKVAPPVEGADGAYVSFDTSAARTVRAKVGVSFTSQANARANREKENPGWDFDGVRTAAYDDWNAKLRRIRIGGGDAEDQRIFYTALYHVLLHPNVFSDVNAEYAGFDGQVHKAPAGHPFYANFSGWDIYRTQTQLAAMIAPRETSDAVRSMLAQDDQTGLLPKWTLANGESYVMVGDPAAPIIADAYAFGARDFDQEHALDALVASATKANNVRPGLDRLMERGYLPTDATYGCCNFYGAVSTQLEYDTADYAVAAYAKALGRNGIATKLAKRAQNWQNVFNPGTGYVQAKHTDGRFQSGFSPSTSEGMVEGTSAQYTPMVPFNVAGLANAAGGRDAWVDRLDGLMRNVADPGPENADLSNEPSFEIPWQYAYVGAPYETQAKVREVQQAIYSTAPDGMAGNDDLGTMSAWYVWSALGMYPQVPGTADMTVGSPVFPRAQVTLANGRKLTIEAPGAATDRPYVQSMKMNGAPWTHAYLEPGVVLDGGKLAFELGSSPNTSWATAPADAPPSYTAGTYPALGFLQPDSQVVVEPGESATVKLGARNLRAAGQRVEWRAKADEGVAAGPASGTLVVPGSGDRTQQVKVTAPEREGRYLVKFSLTGAGGAQLPPVVLQVAVAERGALWPYYNNVGTAQDGVAGNGNYDGGGWAYSAQALAAQGVTPGGEVEANGLTYTWPDSAVGEPDNIAAGGQRIELVAPSAAGRLGLVGSATNASPGAKGEAVVTYTDGTSTTTELGFGDWTLGAGSFPPQYGNVEAVKMPYRNTTSGGRDTVTTYVFATEVGLDEGRKVESVTLPKTTTSGQLHVFAVAFG